MTAHEDRRAGRDQDWTDTEREGMPVTQDLPPGIDQDLAFEGEALPADHPLIVDDKGVTAAEAARPETLRERVARERPDVPQAEAQEPTGRLVTGGDDPVDELTGEWAPDANGLAAEEAAVHIRDR